ncbi:hypothetical protein CSKR_202399, partial [Clonorchis sinensis]
FLVFLVDTFRQNPEYEQLTNLASNPTSPTDFCAKVPELLGRQPFWFRESFISCSKARDAANQPFLFARFHIRSESLGPMHVDQQCLEKLSNQMEKALNTRPDGTIAEVFGLRATPPIRSFVADQNWLADHQKLRLDIDTSIMPEPADVVDIAAIKVHLDKHVSRLDSPASFTPLKTEIGAFEVVGNQFTGQYNIIMEAASLDHQTFAVFQSNIDKHNTDMRVSAHKGLALKIEPAIHKIVVWLEKQMDVTVSGAEASNQDIVDTGNSDRVLDSLDKLGSPESVVASKTESNGIEQKSQTLESLLEALVVQLRLKESLLTIRVDECKTNVDTVCKIRLFFDLFKLSLRLKVSDISEAVCKLTELIQNQESVKVDHGFALRDYGYNPSKILAESVNMKSEQEIRECELELESREQSF